MDRIDSKYGDSGWGYKMSNSPWTEEDSMDFLEFPKNLTYASGEVALEKISETAGELRDLLNR